jgi:hypothetical protein
VESEGRHQADILNKAFGPMYNETGTEETPSSCAAAPVANENSHESPLSREVHRLRCEEFHPTQFLMCCVVENTNAEEQVSEGGEEEGRMSWAMAEAIANNSLMVLSSPLWLCK